MITQHKLNKEVANEIRILHKNGKTPLELVAMYGVSDSTIYDLLNNLTYIDHSNDPPPQLGDYVDCQNNCGKKFLIENRKRYKYCSKKCQLHAQMKRWRSKTNIVLPPKNCEMCADEFMPTRVWQRFCCKDCTSLFNNSYSRKRTLVKKQCRTTNCNDKAQSNTTKGMCYKHYYWLCSSNYFTSKIVLNTTEKKCHSKECNSLCKVIFKDRKIISYPKGCFLLNSKMIFCILCTEKWSYIDNSGKKVVSQDTRKCESIDCNNTIKCLVKDGEIISYQQDCLLMNDMLFCIACKEKINAINIIDEKPRIASAFIRRAEGRYSVSW